ncbi:LysR substrate-binding domain-containing protein [Variovorax rhizosphaerae]|uniref:LysR substrate-binding domain-containing protein n=1 Tax=Variovorax rhizosphaerae TaxID=1836200 RepID=A0ABU8WP24_9BURK
MPSEATRLSNRIDLRHLRYFVAVAEAGSITAAAERLHLSQPPLSVTIKELEQTLDVQLFERHRNGIFLTEAGKAMLEEARSVLARAARGIEHVMQIGRGEMGEVRVGIVSSIMWGDFPQMLKEFHLRYPQVQWSLRESNPADQVLALHDHRIDVGVWRGESQPAPGLERILISKDKLMVVLPAYHPLARRRKVSLAALKSMPYLSLNTTISSIAADSMTAMRGLGLTPEVAHVAREPQTLLALAANGLGFALLAGELARISWPGVVFKPVAEELPTADLYLHVREQAPSPAVARFIEVMREIAK